MQINTALNLVLPIRRDAAGKPTLYAYHTPISREVFEANWRIIGAAYATVFDDPRYAGSAAVRVATLALKDAAKDEGIGLDLAGPLLADIKRLTMILAPTDAGFVPQPVDVAIGRGIIDADDWSEVESVLVFFTCAFSIAPRSRQAPVANRLAPVIGGSITSLPPMEWLASLPTSTPAATTESIITSLVPS